MKKSDTGGDVLEKIVSLAKRRGFIFQGSEMYGGLAGMWDYGPLGLALKENIKQLWWKQFVEERDNVYGVDAAIIMHPHVWEASGHVSGFSDPLCECQMCKHRFRTDQIENPKVCPDCGGKMSNPRQFNMMFKMNVGAAEDAASLTYLRPETAQGMFVNFKNIVDTFHPKLPFGMAQIGKAFRNEIAPRDFTFRTREFEQMEIEYFIRDRDWEKMFEEFRNMTHEFFSNIGLPKEKVHEREVAKEDLAHYSKRTIDFEFEYPFGRKELSGLAYRTDFDLKAHALRSGREKDFQYFDEETQERFTPHVIEPSFGLDRTVLAVLSSAYAEDDMGGEKRAYLTLSSRVAPIKVAVFPLLKNKPDLVSKAEEVYKVVKGNIPSTVFDDNGNIGKRYRRQDEIGTPLCVTVDFDTLSDNTVTVRDRDSGEQKRIKITELISYLSGVLTP